MKYPQLIVSILSGLLAAMLLFPLNLMAAGSFTNGGFNNPFSDISSRTWNGQTEKIATGWSHFYIDANTYRSSENAPKLHWMSSAQFGSTFGGLDYHIEGDAAQVLWSSYDFEGGVYQQVSGLTPGQAYKFFIKMTTYWRGPGFPDTNGVMVKQVGVDPYGGTDPTSPNVVWSNTNADDKAWVGLEAVATAETGTMTVFAKVQAPENDSYNHTDLNMVYFEDSRLDYVADGPETVLTVNTAGTTVNLSWVGSVAAGWALRGHEVQYRDQAGGDWITLQSKISQLTAGSFTGEAGHTYDIRARTWQTNGSIELPGQWDETTAFTGNAVVGRVMDHAGVGLNGVSLSVVGHPTTTVSSNGHYVLVTGPGTFDIVAADSNGLVAPPTATVSVPANDIGEFDFTFRPDGTGQGLQNNDLETDLSHWQVSDGAPSPGGAAAGISGAATHTGSGSLLISQTVQISQTCVVTGMQNPLLSFWYKADAPFTVELLGDPGGLSMQAVDLSRIQTQTLAATANWQHLTVDWPATGVYSGEIGVNFSYNGTNANIFIDEVSLAAGPYKTYLPILLKN